MPLVHRPFTEDLYLAASRLLSQVWYEPVYFWQEEPLFVKGAFADDYKAAVIAQLDAELAGYAKCKMRCPKRRRHDPNYMFADRYVMYRIRTALEPVIAPLRNLEDGVVGGT